MHHGDKAGSEGSAVYVYEQINCSLGRRIFYMTLQSAIARSKLGDTSITRPLISSRM